MPKLLTEVDTYELRNFVSCCKAKRRKNYICLLFYIIRSANACRRHPFCLRGKIRLSLNLFNFRKILLCYLLVEILLHDIITIYYRTYQISAIEMDAYKEESIRAIVEPLIENILKNKSI